MSVVYSYTVYEYLYAALRQALRGSDAHLTLLVLCVAQDFGGHQEVHVYDGDGAPDGAASCRRRQRRARAARRADGAGGLPLRALLCTLVASRVESASAFNNRHNYSTSPLMCSRSRRQNRQSRTPLIFVFFLRRSCSCRSLPYENSDFACSTASFVQYLIQNNQHQHTFMNFVPIPNPKQLHYCWSRR